jgi:hypothetical protein
MVPDYLGVEMDDAREEPRRTVCRRREYDQQDTLCMSVHGATVIIDRAP